MTLDYLLALADQLQANARQLDGLLKPLAQTLPEPSLHASIARSYMDQQLDAMPYSVARAHIVSHDTTIPVSDLVLYSNEIPVLYQEHCYTFVEAKSVRCLVKVLEGEVEELQLIDALRELADKAAQIRSVNQSPLAVGLWAPDAHHWDAPTLTHLVRLAGNNDPNRIISHIAMGKSVYCQVKEKQLSQHWESVNLPSVQADANSLPPKSQYMGGALLLEAMRAHLSIPYSLPMELAAVQTVSNGNGNGSYAKKAIPGMQIPVKGKQLVKGKMAMPLKQQAFKVERPVMTLSLIHI